MYLHFLKDSSFVALEKQAFDAIQRIFPCEEDLLDKIPLEQIVHHFQNQIIGQKNPFLIRVTGQSGSGKSSQLVPALESALQNKSTIKINVAAFAPFHPQYQQWQQQCPNQIREKTNGFALRALVMFYRHCILNQVNIIFDMTLLEPEIDLYLMTLAKKMNYKIQAHVLCVPRKVSDFFIRQRQQATGRIVNSSSSDYFYNALVPCLSALTKSGLFTEKDTLVLWSYHLTEPIQKTHLNNPDSVQILQEYRQGDFAVGNPETLLQAKKIWMKNLMESEDV